MENTNRVTSAALAVAAAAAAATAAILYIRRKERAAPKLDEAYCQPCGDEDHEGDKFYQPTLHRSRSQLLKLEMSSKVALSRQKSVVNNHELSWANYAKAPSTYKNNGGFNAAGAQRIDLPQFTGHDFERVAEFVDREAATTLGLGALGTMHRLGTPERRALWKDQFETLDLGSYDEACRESTKEMDKLCWTVLLIQPNKSFPVHQHPDIEVEFVLRGCLYENRLLAQPDAPLDEAALPESGYPKLFRVNSHTGGSFFSNPRFSVHQSYTMDEGVVLLVLWTGRHTNISDSDGKLWQAERCQNPDCPLACPAKTFRGFAELGKAPGK